MLTGKSKGQRNGKGRGSVRCPVGSLPLPLTVEPVLPPPRPPGPVGPGGGGTRLDTALRVERMGGALLAQAKSISRSVYKKLIMSVVCRENGCLRGRGKGEAFALGVGLVTQETLEN